MALTSNQVETLLTPAQIPVASPAGIYTARFGQPLAALGATAVDVATWTPGHRYKILSFSARTAVAGVGTDAAQEFTLSIGGVAVTGGVLTLTEANQVTTYGQNTAATAITALNEGAVTDSMKILLTTGGTEFSAGVVDLLLRIQNLDG